MFLKYGLPLLLIIAVLGGWEYSKPSYPVSTEANARADHGPPPPHNANEKMFTEHRRLLRASTLEVLDRPWATYCDPEGRKRIASALKEYFYHRGNQELSYPRRWGDAGKTYIEFQWGSTEDRRIEQQIKDMVWRGYLDARSLDERTGKRIAAMTQGTAITRQPCKA
jgi:hypothetical protein